MPLLKSIYADEKPVLPRHSVDPRPYLLPAQEVYTGDFGKKSITFCSGDTLPPIVLGLARAKVVYGIFAAHDDPYALLMAARLVEALFSDRPTEEKLVRIESVAYKLIFVY
jgi:hypothetical protein